MSALEAAEEVIPRLAIVVGAVCKENIRCFCIQERSERRRDTIRMENVYYECIYDVLRNTARHEEKMTKLNHLKAKITNLHRTRMQFAILDNDEPNGLAEERPALFHILQLKKRRGAITIQRVWDDHGNSQRTTKYIMRAFTIFMRRKYEPLAVDVECVAYITEMGRRELPRACRDQLKRSISPEEVYFAVRKGAKNKAPESDGIGLEFYKTNWATIKDYISAMMNQMFTERKVSTYQKQRVIVCLPKSSETTTHADHRLIILLNTNYNVLARIIVNRLRP